MPNSQTLILLYALDYNLHLQLFRNGHRSSTLSLCELLVYFQQENASRGLFIATCCNGSLRGSGVPIPSAAGRPSPRHTSNADTRSATSIMGWWRVPTWRAGGGSHWWSSRSGRGSSHWISSFSGQQISTRIQQIGDKEKQTLGRKVKEVCIEMGTDYITTSAETIGESAAMVIIKKTLEAIGYKVKT